MMWTTDQGCAPAVEILWELCGLGASGVNTTDACRPRSVVVVTHSDTKQAFRFHSATITAGVPTPVGGIYHKWLSFGSPYYCMEYSKSSSHAE